MPDEAFDYLPEEVIAAIATGVAPVAAKGADQDLQWVDSSDQILEKLESDVTTAEDRLTAVLFAEITAFEESQKPRLLQGLFQFIERYRFYTADDEVVTAVGAAIRKSALNMPKTEFEHYAQFFLPTATDALSSGIELELAKAVGWRLAKSGPLRSGVYPNLEARLSELASDYLTPRLILQKNYASIVSHALVGVALLGGARQVELLDRARELGMDWFRDVLARRFAEVADDHRESNPDGAANLERLRARLFAGSP